MKPGLKKLIICISSFLVMALVCYFGGYYFSLDFFRFDTIRSMDEVFLKNPVLANGQDEVEADMNENAFIKKDTVFILQDFNLETNEATDNKMNMPIEYLGMNLKETSDYISRNFDKYKEDGMELVNVMLISFSENKMVIRRCYKEKEEETTTIPEAEGEIKYYIMEKDGYITIFKADKLTIFLNTEILAATLSPEDVQLLKEGVGVKDIFEMYGYLESFTS